MKRKGWIWSARVAKTPRWLLEFWSGWGRGKPKILVVWEGLMKGRVRYKVLWTTILDSDYGDFELWILRVKNWWGEILKVRVGKSVSEESSFPNYILWVFKVNVCQLEDEMLMPEMGYEQPQTLALSYFISILYL